MKLDTNNAGFMAQRPFWFIVSDSMPVTDYALVDPDDAPYDHPKLVMMFPVTMFQNEWRRTSLIYIRHIWDHRLTDGTEGCMGSTSGFSSLACWSNLSSPLSFTASWYLMSDKWECKPRFVASPVHRLYIHPKFCRSFLEIRWPSVWSTQSVALENSKQLLLVLGNLRTKSWNKNHKFVWGVCIEGRDFVTLLQTAALTRTLQLLVCLVNVWLLMRLIAQTRQN